MKRLWNDHPYALTGFVLAAAVTTFFLVRLVLHGIYWSDPAHRNMAPEPWMTVGFVARSWGLEPREIDARADFPSPGPGQGHPLTLQDIANQRGVPVEQIIAQLEAALLTMKAAEPAP